MRTKQGFELRKVAGESVIIATGSKNTDFSSIISLNESAAYLWVNVEGKEFSQETLTELLIQEYEVEPVTARNDADQLIRSWIKAGIISQ